ncbi:hypothetical protein JCM11491_000443 [Sporobolomyces phaffii]
MDNIPVDGPPAVPLQATYQPPPLHSGGGGGALNFEENMNDVPRELTNQQQQQQQHQSNDGRTFGSSTSNLAAYPSVLAPAPTPHHFSPAPGIPPNAPPQTMPPLVPGGVGPDGQIIPVKRPRGRPRKIPGVDSRPAQPRPEGTTAGRGRPKGSRGTRGRGRPRGSGMKARGKRARSSSDEDDDDISVDDSSDDDDHKRRRGGKKDQDVDLNEEVDDDFGPEGKVGATTKFGRKISKPKSFVPTNKPTITRKKRQSTAASQFEANLMCQVCHLGHSPPGNALVICEACSHGYHQLCSVPIITDEIVASDVPFFCANCDAKISEMKKEENVLEGEWTTGQGEDKGDATATNVLPVPPAAATTTTADGGPGGEGDKKKEDEPQMDTDDAAGEVDKEVEKTKPYSEAVKKEWLLSLPVNTLVGYILSVEKKYAPTEAPENGLPIWPKDLPNKLQAAKDARAAEAAERERRLEEEAEALAAAAAAETPGGGGTETNSEAGTPLSFDLLPGETGGGARTAASKRLQSEREAREAAQATVQLAKEQQQQHQHRASDPTRSNPQTVPAYMRPAIPMASALGGGGGGGGGGGDIQVGGPSSNGGTSGTSSSLTSHHQASNAAAAALAHQQATQQAQAAAAQAQANRYAAYPSYAQQAPSSSAYGNLGVGAGVGVAGGYGFLSGSPNAGGVAGSYQSPAPGAYANMYAQPQPGQPQHQTHQQQGGGYSSTGAGSPWGRTQGGN